MINILGTTCTKFYHSRSGFVGCISKTFWYVFSVHSVVVEVFVARVLNLIILIILRLLIAVFGMSVLLHTPDTT